MEGTSQQEQLRVFGEQCESGVDMNLVELNLALQVRRRCSIPEAYGLIGFRLGLQQTQHGPRRFEMTRDLV